ncbi:MAG: DUF4276 family protein [Alphaproteobacteria bacterium]|nr:DUF4276 family protein [Alphaproteobacteria bacterium]
MVTVGYFCTKSYTEVGGIQALLQKINPRVRWQRCFPAVLKPGPKPGRLALPLGDQDMGATGESLIRRMEQRLRDHYRGAALDALLLIDDADCRFCGDDPPKSQAEAIEALTRRARTALGRDDIPVFALFASPEVEAWLLADWDRSFGADHPHLSHTLRHHLAQRLTPHWPATEGYGCPELRGGGCTTKLSEVLQDVMADPATYAWAKLDPAKDGRRYSKKVDGALMLQRVRPERISEHCSLFFAPVARQLAALP